MLKVAVIGSGAICPSHIKGFLTFPERCEIVALVDIYPEKAKQLAERFNLQAEAYEDYKALLDQDIDLVSICTPPHTHAEITIDFLKAGKHVIVEKPMASSLEECDAMIQAAEQSGKTLSVIAQNRFRTPMMRLKSILDTGLMGDIVHAQVDSFWWRGHSYYDLWWRGTWEMEGGGCTLNHAVHHIDALLWMMGRPTEVQAIMSNTSHDNAEVEDLSIAILRYPNGALAQVTSSVVHHGEEQQLVFQGKDARVSVPWRVSASTAQENGFPVRNEQLEEKLESSYQALEEVEHEAHIGQIENVLTAIERNEPVLIDGQSGRNTLELITAIYKSASTGQAVPLPLSTDDAFYTRGGTPKHAIHFYEKKASVDNFQKSDITTGSDYRS